MHFCLDDDDPALEEYERCSPSRRSRRRADHGPRVSFAAWTNEIALKRAREYLFLASFGDDHVPRTRGFDKARVDACTQDGPAIAYPWDGMREDIPEAPVVSSEIVPALGWLIDPAVSHYYGDNTLADLGPGAGACGPSRLAVGHRHPGRGAGTSDATYGSASPLSRPTGPPTRHGAPADGR